jgi:DNA-binding GntR family transcriptional regulator
MNLEFSIAPEQRDARLAAGGATLTPCSRIREDLREHIASGAWQVHDRVPSESALMKQYGGKPLDYEHLYCRADNFQYRLRLNRSPVTGSAT